MQNFLIGVGASIVAAIIVALIPPLRRWIFRSVQSVGHTWNSARRLVSAGVFAFYARRSDYVKHRRQSTISEYLDTSKRSIAYVGFWLAHGTEIEDIANTIPRLLQNGRSVSLLFMDPASPHLASLSEYLNIDAQQIAQRIRASIGKFSRARQDLNPAERDRLSLRIHHAPLTASAFLIDIDTPQAKILVDVKIFGLSRDDSYGMELRGVGSQMFDKFRRSYEMVISQSSPIEDTDLAEFNQ
jgi:hypothetical protein